MPREGHLANGSGYFVHGVGYTVVTESGGEVHLDAGDNGAEDVFSVHDIHAFLETSGCDNVPTIETIRDSLNQLEAAGKILREGRRFSILQID
jgi:hypothetical protein